MSDCDDSPRTEGSTRTEYSSRRKLREWVIQVEEKQKEHGITSKKRRSCPRVKEDVYIEYLPILSSLLSA